MAKSALTFHHDAAAHVLHVRLDFDVGMKVRSLQHVVENEGKSGRLSDATFCIHHEANVQLVIPTREGHCDVNLCYRPVQPLGHSIKGTNGSDDQRVLACVPT